MELASSLELLHIQKVALFLEMRLSSNLIFESLSFTAKSFSLIDHMVWNSETAWWSAIFLLLDPPFAALTPGGRFVGWSPRLVVAWELSDCAPSSHLLFLALPSILLVACSHHFGRVSAPPQHVEEWISSYDRCRRFRLPAKQHHSHSGHSHSKHASDCDSSLPYQSFEMLVAPLPLHLQAHHPGYPQNFVFFRIVFKLLSFLAAFTPKKRFTFLLVLFNLVCLPLSECRGCFLQWWQREWR